MILLCFQNLYSFSFHVDLINPAGLADRSEQNIPLHEKQVPDIFFAGIEKRFALTFFCDFIDFPVG